jgi:ribosomal protein S18 acetylase RimI-like enzyme
MTIENSTAADIDEICWLYAEASAYMQGRSVVVWPQFERGMVEKEILQQQQWKLVLNGRTACVWATTFTDAQIWEERNADPAVYIHRIAVHPAYRGQQLVLQIVAWAKEYAKAHNKKMIRLDTVGDNKGLIKHYTHCGFNFLGLFKLRNTEGLPPHYTHASVSLFELPVN